MLSHDVAHRILAHSMAQPAHLQFAPANVWAIKKTWEAICHELAEQTAINLYAWSRGETVAEAAEKWKTTAPKNQEHFRRGARCTLGFEQAGPSSLNQKDIK